MTRLLIEKGMFNKEEFLEMKVGGSGDKGVKRKPKLN